MLPTDDNKYSMQQRGEDIEDSKRIEEKKKEAEKRRKKEEENASQSSEADSKAKE